MCCDGLIKKFPQVKTCCFCCSVETGSKVLAWLVLVFGALNLLFIIVGLAAGIVEEPTERETITALKVSAIIQSIFWVFFCIMAVILLIGLYKENMGKVWLWLRVSIWVLFVLVVIAIVDIIVIALHPDLTVGMIALRVVLDILQVAFLFYMIIVVKSHYFSKAQ